MIDKFSALFVAMLYGNFNIQVEFSSVEHYIALRPFYFKIYLKNRTSDLTSFDPFSQIPV